MACGDPTCASCGELLPCSRLSCQRQEAVTAVTFGFLPNDIRTWTRDDLASTLTEYLDDEVFANRFADCISMIKQKNSDYTGGLAKRDRIAHFRGAAKDLELPMMKIWQVFVRKHWAAVQKFANGGHLESEPIDGRINDIINYMVLLGAIIDDAERK